VALSRLPGQLRRLQKLLNRIETAAKRDWEALLARIERPPDLAERRHGLLWTVNFNRRVEVSVWLSRETVKADAARRLFQIDCGALRWAVVDSGIDATHPAFRRRDGSERDPDDHFENPSRVRCTYDFTRLRELLHRAQRSAPPSRKPSCFDQLPALERQNLTDDLQRTLLRGRPLNWALLDPFLRVPHDRITTRSRPIATEHT